ncbi:MAG: adenosylcobinamide-GDP ribazoletransferase [Lachnospiraceae bacterium]|nr:adenosylcobinamide-GDP ribazoletransferase [Lachnospiraceae bacterium]
MRNAAESFIIAFSMYSRLPMPAVKWNDDNRRYVFAFFPFVGAVEGLIFYYLWILLDRIHCGALLTGALLTLFTILFTGGIHLDGFMDVRDALASYRSVEERLRILKDPHVGSFAVIWAVMLLIVKTAVYGSLSREILPLTAITFFLSRSLSALSVLGFPEAYKEGTAFSFKSAAAKSVKPLLIIFALLSFGAAFYISVRGAAVLLFLSAVLMICHYRNCTVNFGGINGDTAGCFLELFETAVPLIMVITEPVL